MPNNERPTRVYEDLAEWYDRTGQAKLRDWFLVLAADAALTGGRAKDAERLRSRLLQNSPHHLLKPYSSFTEALQSPDVQGYVADLRRTYPPEAAASLLATQRQTAADRGAQGHQPPPKAAGLSPLPTELFPSATAEPKVFRMQPAGEEPQTRANAAVPRQPAVTHPPTRPEPAPAPRMSAQPRPRVPQSAPPIRAAAPVRGPRAPETIEDGATGAWLSSGLFFLVVLASLALAVYTFARPFLSPGWLP